MKKLFYAAIAAFCVSACSLPDPTYTAIGLSGFFSVYEVPQLIADNGFSFIVTEDKTDGGWKDAGRFYAEYDILDINYHTRLNYYLAARVEAPIAGIPEEDAENDFKDNVVFLTHSIGADGYLNLLLERYSLKGSNYAHRSHLYYKDDPGAEILYLAFLHDGNGETPANYQESELEQTASVCSFPLADIVPKGSNRTVYFTYYVLDAEKNPKRNTVILYNSEAKF